MIKTLLVAGETLYRSSMRWPTTQIMSLPDCRIRQSFFCLALNLRSVIKSLNFFLLRFIPRGQNQSPMDQWRNTRGYVILSRSKHPVSRSRGTIKESSMSCSSSRKMLSSTWYSPLAAKRVRLSSFS